MTQPRLTPKINNKMDKVLIQATGRTPFIRLDAEEGYIEIKGRSTPENTEQVYKQVIRWIEEYLLHPQQSTVIDFNFEYLNSSSAKVLIYLMNKLLVASKSKITQLSIIWGYSDDDMLEVGKDFESITGMKFKFVYDDTDDD